MIEAELAAAKADLMAHKANSDVESASGSVQQIANLEAERANLTALISKLCREPSTTPALKVREYAGGQADLPK